MNIEDALLLLNSRKIEEQMQGASLIINAGSLHEIIGRLVGEWQRTEGLDILELLAHTVKHVKPIFLLLEEKKKKLGWAVVVELLQQLILESTVGHKQYLLQGIEKLKKIIEKNYPDSQLIEWSHCYFYNRSIQGERNVYTICISHLFTFAIYYSESNTSVEDYDYHLASLGRVVCFLEENPVHFSLHQKFLDIAQSNI